MIKSLILFGWLGWSWIGDNGKTNWTTSPIGLTPDAIEIHEQPQDPPVSPLLSVDLAFTAPILLTHPAPKDIPAGGSFYRIPSDEDPTILELWFVRDDDHVATQLSAHDRLGRPINRTRDLDTGVEEIIPLYEIKEKSAPLDVLKEIRVTLRLTNKVAIANLISWSDSNRLAVASQRFNTNGNAATVRSAVLANINTDIEQQKQIEETARQLQKLRKLVNRSLGAVDDEQGDPE